MFRALMQTRAPAATILIRALAGGVFLSEGIQKFLYPAEVGAGRFEKIGIPSPEVLGPLVGAVEVIGGALLLLGLLTRVAALPLLIDMAVAIVSTKVPILLGREFWGFSLREMPNYGFWSMAHEARTGWAMLLGALFLLIVGAGPWSVDGALRRPTPDADKGAGAHA